jgi:hypothetical protein
MHSPNNGRLCMLMVQVSGLGLYKVMYAEV